MPSRLKHYKDKKKALVYRNRHRKKNYHRGNFSLSPYNLWEYWEYKIILKCKRKSDIYLAKLLQRSIQSIQIKRCRLLKEQ